MVSYDLFSLSFSASSDAVLEASRKCTLPAWDPRGSFLNDKAAHSMHRSIVRLPEVEKLMELHVRRILLDRGTWKIRTWRVGSRFHILDRGPRRWTVTKKLKSFMVAICDRDGAFNHKKKNTRNLSESFYFYLFFNCFNFLFNCFCSQALYSWNTLWTILLVCILLSYTHMHITGCEVELASYTFSELQSSTSYIVNQ